MSSITDVAIAVCLVGFWSSPDAWAADPTDQAPALEMIAQRTEQNEQTFKTFACRFRLALGSAPSIADAMRDGPVNPPFTADGIWTVKGEASTFELNTPQDSLEKARRLPQNNGVVTQVALPFTDMKFIGDGRQQWFYTYHSAIECGLIERVNNRSVNFQTPFVTCLESEHQIGSAAKLIRRGLQRGSVRLLPPAAAETQNIQRVELVEESAGIDRVKVITIIKFDADRGYLPMGNLSWNLGKARRY